MKSLTQRLEELEAKHLGADGWTIIRRLVDPGDADREPSRVIRGPGGMIAMRRLDTESGAMFLDRVSAAARAAGTQNVIVE